VGFHGVTRDIGVVAHIGVVKIGNFLVLRPEKLVRNWLRGHVAKLLMGREYSEK
jgi:hypothetical protein